MRAVHYLAVLGFAATMTAATPAAAVNTVKIIDANGYWLDYTGFKSFPGLMTQVYGNGWSCAGVMSTVGQYMGGGNGASCGGAAGIVVYKSGGEWWADYP